MYISITYFAGLLIVLLWFLPRWVCRYELLYSYVHVRYVPFNHVASWCSGTIVETLLSYSMWSIPVLSCRWYLKF
jgi:hypothetical protein